MQKRLVCVSIRLCSICILLHFVTWTTAKLAGSRYLYPADIRSRFFVLLLAADWSLMFGWFLLHSDWWAAGECRNLIGRPWRRRIRPRSRSWRRTGLSPAGPKTDSTISAWRSITSIIAKIVYVTANVHCPVVDTYNVWSRELQEKIKAPAQRTKKIANIKFYKDNNLLCFSSYFNEENKSYSSFKIIASLHDLWWKAN